MARQPKDKNKWDNRCFFLKSELKPSSNKLRDQALYAAINSLLRLAISMRRISPQLRPSAEDVRRNMTFVTVKSLYYVAWTRLRDYVNHLQDQDERGPPLAKVWFETRRLDAWASVLEIGMDELKPIKSLTKPLIRQEETDVFLSKY